MTFLEPSPLLIALIFVKRFVFLELLILLALLRGLLARGPSRALALLCALLCAAAILVTFAPAFNITTQPWYGPAARLLASGQGMIVPLALSALFALSGRVAGARLRLLDWLNGGLALALLGLWAVTLF